MRQELFASRTDNVGNFGAGPEQNLPLWLSGFVTSLLAVSALTDLTLRPRRRWITGNGDGKRCADIKPFASTNLSVSVFNISDITTG